MADGPSSPESAEQAGIRAAQERQQAIGRDLGQKAREDALEQSIQTGLPSGGTTMAPSSEGTGVSPFELAANQGTLPAKDVSAEDQAMVAKRLLRVRKGNTG